MGFQNWSDDIILVDLPREPRMRSELKTLVEIVRDRGDCDVVVDFSSVDIMTSTSISGLLRLRKLADRLRPSPDILQRSRCYEKCFQRSRTR